MYRDDTCAVCGESLPPDHFYCREHAATVDDRLHEIAALLPRLRDDTSRLGLLLTQVAEETWDYVTEREPDDPDWPPAPTVAVRADADEVTVDVDSEPGFVNVVLRVSLAQVLAAVGQALEPDEWRRLAGALGEVDGANATH